MRDTPHSLLRAPGSAPGRSRSDVCSGWTARELRPAEISAGAADRFLASCAFAAHAGGGPRLPADVRHVPGPERPPPSHGAAAAPRHHPGRSEALHRLRDVLADTHLQPVLLGLRPEAVVGHHLDAKKTELCA